MRLTSFLGVCHNLCSEFVLHVERLKEISATFRNSMKIVLNFIVNINQMRNNHDHESAYFNLIGHFLQLLHGEKFWTRTRSNIQTWENLKQYGYTKL